MIAYNQSNYSYDSKIGHFFIQFITLILSSCIESTWKSTDLYKIFSSSHDILDEMRPIRFIQNANGTNETSPFKGAQEKIREAFGFKIPVSWGPTFPARQKPKA